MGIVPDADMAIAAPQRACNSLKALEPTGDQSRSSAALGASKGRWGRGSRLVAMKPAAIDVDRDPLGLRLTSLTGAQCILSGWPVVAP